MKNSSRLARIVFALTFSVVTLGASVTHAEGTPYWKVNGEKLTYLLEPSIQVTEIEKLPATGTKEVILLSKIGLTKVEILCTEAKLAFATKLIWTGALAGRAVFSGCITKLNGGAASGPCKPHSPGAPEGLIETNSLNGRLVLHLGVVGWEHLIEVEGVGNIADVRLGKEVFSECSLGWKLEVTGKIIAKAGTTSELGENTKTKLFSEGPLSELRMGGNQATIDGSVKVALTTFHEGLTWSGFAN